MVAGETNVKFLDVIPEFREVLGREVPISLDSLNAKELEAGLDFVDMILSVDWSNVEDLVTDKPVVLIPTDMKNGYFPLNPRDRVESLEKLKEKALSLGYKRIIADLILEHYPGFSRSIVAFSLYRDRNREDIMLAGVGNVTEMTDADSPGINALLAGIASELRISMLLTTEVSRKCTGSIRELRRAIDMTLLGGVKDVGLNLLLLKEKKDKGLRFEISKNIVEAKRKEVKLEDTYFRIFVDNGKIYVNAYKGMNLVITIVGNEPNEIMDTILDYFSLSPRHAFYLGRELEKAYTALKLRRSYAQEEELFRDFYTKKIYNP